MKFPSAKSNFKIQEEQCAKSQTASTFYIARKFCGNAVLKSSNFVLNTKLSKTKPGAGGEHRE
jgi:hypothetical protein